MPVSIDEVTAEVEPSRSGSAPGGNSQAAGASPDVELRKLQEMLARAQERAARLCAD